MKKEKSVPPKKNPDGNPTRNAVTLFSLLVFSGRPYSLKRLSEILDCSRQTVLRLIDQIDMSGRVTVRKWKEDGQSYYQILTGPNRPKVVLSEDEIAQLVLCKEWMQHLLPSGIRQKLDHTVEKVAVLLEDYEDRAEAFQPLGQCAVKGKIDYSAYEKILERLIGSIRSRQVLEVLYQSPRRHEPKKHVLVPVHIVAFHEGLYIRGWLVTERGYPEATKDITLAIHRLVCVQPTRRTLPEKALSELPPLEGGYFGLSRQTTPFEVKAQFYGGGANYVRERTWSKDDRFEDGGDGSVILNFTAQSELEVIKWILGFGTDARLLAPESLRLRVKDELRQALNFYD
ncbi:MAG: WYL domain-containing protein [Negativicutes bacterium]|nr:WYL domain-containing protein [Negativicutes bacterium]